MSGPAPEGRELIPSGKEAFAVAWNTAGRLAATGAGIRVWPASGDGEPVVYLGGDFTLAWSRDGRRLAADNSLVTGEIQVIDAESGTSNAITPDHGRNLWAISSLAWDPAGQRIASAGWDHTLRVQDVAPGRLLWLAVALADKQFGVFSETGELLHASNAELPGLVYVIDEQATGFRVLSSAEFQERARLGSKP